MIRCCIVHRDLSSRAVRALDGGSCGEASYGTEGVVLVNPKVDDACEDHTINVE